MYNVQCASTINLMNVVDNLSVYSNCKNPEQSQLIYVVVIINIFDSLIFMFAFCVLLHYVNNMHCI